MIVITKAMLLGQIAVVQLANAEQKQKFTYQRNNTGGTLQAHLG